jgi:hypothetical protein
MPKNVIFILLLSVVAINLTMAQLMLCQTSNGHISVIDSEFNSTETISTNQGDLVGYDLSNDTLTIYIKKIDGKISEEFYVSEKFDLTTNRNNNGLIFSKGYILVKTRNDSRFFKENDSLKTLNEIVYHETSGNTIIAVDDCSDVFLFENGEQIKLIRGVANFSSLGCYSTTDTKKTIQLSNDNKMIFLTEREYAFGRKRNIIFEVDLRNGSHEKIYSHNNITYVSYSDDFARIHFNVEEDGRMSAYEYDRKKGELNFFWVTIDTTNKRVKKAFCL